MARVLPELEFLFPQVVSIYEILRRFQTILRLSPFRLEDFCAALSSEDQSNLLSEVHLSLLKALIRYECMRNVPHFQITCRGNNFTLPFIDLKSRSQRRLVPLTRRTVLMQSSSLRTHSRGQRLFALFCKPNPSYMPNLSSS